MNIHTEYLILKRPLLLRARLRVTQTTQIWRSISVVYENILRIWQICTLICVVCVVCQDFHPPLPPYTTLTLTPISFSAAMLWLVRVAVVAFWGHFAGSATAWQISQTNNANPTVCLFDWEVDLRCLDLICVVCICEICVMRSLVYGCDEANYGVHLATITLQFL